MRRAALLAAALGLAACSEAPVNAVYPHNRCHRLTLIDAATQKPVIGAEDIARLPDGSLLVSAYDRRTNGPDGIPPEGGLYIVPPHALAEESFAAVSLFSSFPGGLRPHGVDTAGLADGTVKAAFVNRGYEGSKLEVAIVEFAIAPEGASTPRIRKDPAFCRANDVAYYTASSALDALAVTLDRHYCDGFSAFFENISGRSAAAILTLDSNSAVTTATGLAFANGIGIQYPDRPLGDENFLAVAETRANRLRYFPKSERRDTVLLPGSPDNIAVGRPGIVLAALHPSLLRLALYRYGWPGFSRAPSRIVKISGDQVLILFDDPSGALFSAASVAVQTAGKLVLGSVGDRGLLVCAAQEKPEETS